MLKILLVICGFLSLGIGIVGIAVPGLPSTPFFLLSAGCFMKGSDRLHRWLLAHKFFGAHIRRYRERRAMTVRAKLVSLASMWALITVSVVFFIQNDAVRLVVLGAGLAGTLMMVFVIRTWREDASTGGKK